MKLDQELKKIYRGDLLLGTIKKGENIINELRNSIDKDEKNKVIRVYVYEELYNKVNEFALSRWELYKDRAPNGCPLFKSFPASLKKYIELKPNNNDIYLKIKLDHEKDKIKLNELLFKIRHLREKIKKNENKYEIPRREGK